MKRCLVLIWAFLGAGILSMNAQSIVKDEITPDGIRLVQVTPDDAVCSVNLDITLKGNVIQSVEYTRGCNGNAKGINALIKDMTMDEAIKRLDGITCGKLKTSCPDQLAKSLKLIKKHKATLVQQFSAKK